MYISPFAIILIIYIARVIYKTRDTQKIFVELLGITIIVTLNVRMGCFIRIGDKLLTYNSVLVYSLGIIALIQLEKKNRNNHKVLGMIIILLLAANMILQVLKPYTGTIIINWDHYLSTMNRYIIYSDYNGRVGGISLGYYLIVFFNIVSVLCIEAVLDENDKKMLLTKTCNASKIFVFYGMIECFIMNVFRKVITINISTFIFGKVGAHHTLLTRRGRLYLFQGTTQEASMFNFVLFFSALLFMMEYKKTNNKKRACCMARWTVLCCLLLVLNPTLSSVVYLLIIAVLSYFRIFARKKKKSIMILSALCIPAMIIVILLLINYICFMIPDSEIVTRINEALKFEQAYSNGIPKYSSTGIRFTGIKHTFNIFLERPLFGIGLNQINCDSGIVSSLCCFGLLGTGAWIIFLIQSFKLKKIYVEYIILCLAIIVFPNIFLNTFDHLFLLVIPFLLSCYNKKQLGAIQC